MGSSNSRKRRSLCGILGREGLQRARAPEEYEDPGPSPSHTPNLSSECLNDSPPPPPSRATASSAGGCVEGGGKVFVPKNFWNPSAPVEVGCTVGVQVGPEGWVAGYPLLLSSPVWQSHGGRIHPSPGISPMPAAGGQPDLHDRVVFVRQPPQVFPWWRDMGTPAWKGAGPRGG